MVNLFFFFESYFTNFWTGSGIAGVSFGYFLKEGIGKDLEIDLTYFEKENEVGGRMKNWVMDDIRVELGASMFVEENFNMYNLTQRFGLSKREITGTRVSIQVGEVGWNLRKKWKGFDEKKERRLNRNIWWEFSEELTKIMKFE